MEQPPSREKTDDAPAVGHDPTALLALTDDDLFLDRALEGDDLDEFDRTTIAARIAELACRATAPVNIGLFGPWGSGKSSMATLIEEALTQRAAGEPRVKLIRYDAWKYGGHSLRRNFISNAATELGILAENRDGHRFHRGLYENRRQIEVDAGQFLRSVVPIGLRFVGLFALFLLVSTLVLKVASLLTDRVSGHAGVITPSVLLGGALATFAVAAVRTIFDSGTVQIEQNRPSEDEEFSAAFGHLIRRATTTLPERGFVRHLAAYRHWRLDPERDLFALWRRWWSGISLPEQRERWARSYPGFSRLVFFIDELDRCDERDVVATLGALRTFLDEGPCAFIVAADREVLEHALQCEAEQVTPIHEEAPSYSLAGAFLDKIFQYQITLPPLRGRRLTAFAREKVRERERGIWFELRQAGLLERVLPALIPSQVQSPRRVKVLLNNFATTARIARSRGVEWPGRAEEIAKLTALRTEFPQFAQALATEPRLPRLLLIGDAEGIPDDERVQRLLARFRAPGGGESFLAEAADSDAAGDAGWQVMAERQAQNLQRYLRGNEHIPGPLSDLIYLEPAGATFGLDDPALGDRIDRDAADVPEDVRREIAERDADEQNKAIQLLAEIMPDGLGRQRKNMLAVLLDTAEYLAREESLGADAALAGARAIGVYLDEEGPLDQARLMGALRVALAGDDESLAGRIFDDERLFAADDDLQTVARLYEQLPGAAQGAVRNQIAERLGENPDLLTATLAGIPETNAVELYRHGKISSAVAVAIDGGEETAAEPTGRLVEGLLEGALPSPDRDSRPAQLTTILRDLVMLRNPIVAGVFTERCAQIRECTREPSCWNGYVLRLWSNAAPSDWGHWREQLIEGSAFEDSSLAEDLLCALFEGYTAEPEEIQGQLPSMVSGAMGHLTWAEEPDAMDSVIARIGGALSEPWWTSAEGRKARIPLYEAARLIIAREPKTTAAINELLAADLEAGLRQAETQSNAAMDTAQALANGLDAEHLKRLAGTLPEPGTVIEPQQGVMVDLSRVLRTRASLAAAATQAGDADLNSAPFAIELETVVEAIKSESDASDDAVAAWLELGPWYTAVRKVLAGGDYRSGPSIRAALGRWGATLSRKQRSSFLLAMLRPDRDTAKLIEAVAIGDFEEARVIDAVLGIMQKLRLNKDERVRLASQAAALAPKAPGGQRALANLIAWLLDRRRKAWPAGDVEVAVAALGGLGTRHQSKRRLNELFAKAAPRAGRRLKDHEIRAFERAGLVVPSEMVRKTARKGLLGFLK